MADSILTYRYNVMRIHSLQAFCRVKGGYQHGVRDVYFVRVLGWEPGYGAIIRSVDRRMEEERDKGALSYLRIGALPSLGGSEVAYYSSALDTWKENKQTRLLRYDKAGARFDEVLSAALLEIAGMYRNAKQASPSMVRNFMTKVLYWTDTVVAGQCLHGWNERKSIKIIAENAVKEQEYLFYYFLTKLGCDVLLLQMSEDARVCEDWKALSQMIVVGEFTAERLPAYKNEVQPAHDKGERHKVAVDIPAHTKRTQTSVADKAICCTTTVQTSAHATNMASQREKSLEELATLASSVVMITMHECGGEIVSTGSGIMIGENGYILTNCHVIKGGRYYSVRIEDDDDTYTTDELIKYNDNLDMAVIRIPRKLVPLPIYQGASKPVRGQRVVAIGSPLGLFNSVSDGIISGFRTIRGVDMIQFTAPISPGSSGGAVINLYGQVIGISTGGMDNGQNINLAMGYENILRFAKGFYGKS